MRRVGAVGFAVALALAACAGSATAPAVSPGVTLEPGASPFATQSDGDFHLDLRLPKLTWAVGEPMTGTASLSNAGRAPIGIYGSGSGPISFTYAEVGGKRMLEGAWTADCGGPQAVVPGVPITSPLLKSGGYRPDNPDDAWIEAFMGASGVQLPAGMWDVTASAQFFDSAGCGGRGYTLKATVRVVVG